MSIQTGTDTQPPTAPASLTATALGSTSIGLSWPAATDNSGVTGYRIYRAGTQIGTTTALSYTNTGLTPGTTYSYAVRAVDAAGNLSASVSASATTPGGDTQPPTAPGTLTGTATRGHKVSLRWGLASDNVGVAAYRVYRGTTQVAQVSTLTVLFSAGRGTFTYTVRAVDAAGNVGPASNAVTVRT